MLKIQTHPLARIQRRFTTPSAVILYDRYYGFIAKPQNAEAQFHSLHAL